MNKYGHNLPQLNGKKFLTDGGLETTLIYHHGIDLPHFASFPMILNPNEWNILKNYFISYIEISKRNHLGFVLESPTFRSNTDWGYRLGYTMDELNAINELSIKQLLELREEFENENTPMVVSGCVGPRGDGYVVSEKMTAAEAKQYHFCQVRAFKNAGADMITSFTINYIEEAMGIALAAKELNIPAVIGFTVETDGNLPDGYSLQEAIEHIDELSGDYPAYYMINCAHPSHFADKLKEGAEWVSRIMAVRANASAKSHAELDESTQLDAGDKNDLAMRYRDLNELLPNLKVIGGCCGTDHTHVNAICDHLEVSA